MSAAEGEVASMEQLSDKLRVEAAIADWALVRTPGSLRIVFGSPEDAVVPTVMLQLTKYNPHGDVWWMQWESSFARRVAMLESGTRVDVPRGVSYELSRANADWVVWSHLKAVCDHHGKPAAYHRKFSARWNANPVTLHEIRAASS